MNRPDEYGAVILSMNRGLWGEVSPALRTVQVAYGDSEINLYCYFSGDVCDADVESMQVVGTSFAADFPAHKVFEHCVSLAPSAPLPQIDGRHTVFLRREQPS